MKNKVIVRVLVCAVVLFLLPGCGQYICRIQNLFIPAGKVCMSVEDIQACAVKTIPVRPDGLMTLEIIHILYKSNAVIEFHERLQGDCAGEREDIIEKKIQEQLELNKDKMVFFISLYGVQADWSFTIRKDGHIYKAAEVKVIDLDRNYTVIFGPAAFRYRQNLYQVTFDAAVTVPFEFVACNGTYLGCALFDC